MLTCLLPLRADEQQTLIDRLMKTRAVNIETISDAQFGQANTARGFRMTDMIIPLNGNGPD